MAIFVGCADHDQDPAADPQGGSGSNARTAGAGGTLHAGARASTGGGAAGDGATEPIGGVGGTDAGAGPGGTDASAGPGGTDANGGVGGADAGDAEAGAGGAESEPLREYVLDSGHIDLFDITYDAELSELVTRLRDDTQLYTWTTESRLPETVTVSVDPASAATEIPEGLPQEFSFLGPAGSTIFILDEVQGERLPWPGWSTERLPATLPPGLELPNVLGAVELAVEVTGPGDVFTWMTDASGLPSRRYINTSDDTPDVIPMAPPSHVHTAWAFTEPGDYYLEVTPSAVTTLGVELEGPSHRYHFYIGPSRLPAIEAPALSITGLANPYVMGDTVTLIVVQDPPTSLATYLWYRWQEAGGYALLPRLTGADAVFTATTSAQYAAVLLSKPNGRIVAYATAHLVVSP